MDLQQRQRIVPYYMIDSDAANAADFYAALFSALFNALSQVDALPQGSGRTAHARTAHTTIHGEHPAHSTVVVDGFEIGLMSGQLNGQDPAITPTGAISLMLNFDPLIFGDQPTATKHLRSLWEALTTDGQVLMELGDYPFSELYGWVVDRHGISWQLMLTNPEGEPRPFVVPNLLFGGDLAQDQAGPAVDSYTALFYEVFDGESAVGARVFYPGPQPAPSSVMFSDFQLAGTWFSAMDSGVPQPQGFTPGTSLLVRCDTQAQVDALREALSVDAAAADVPSAKSSDWLTDRYGLNWRPVLLG